MCHHEWVDLQQMRYVVAVAEERSFTRAAQRCFVVQSALSHQIKALERELGVTLFARSSRRVDLTPSGEAFLLGARACLAAAERAATDAAAASGVIRGELAIGMIPTVTACDLPAGIARFHHAHPQVRIRVRDGGSDEFIEALKAGTLDLAVLGLGAGRPPQGVEARELSRNSLVAVLPAEHALSRRRRLALEDLAEETFVDFPAGSAGRLQSEEAFAAAGLRREVPYEAMSTPFMLDLVARGLTVALLPAGVVPPREDLRTIAVQDGPQRVEYLAWSAFNPSPAVIAFISSVFPDMGRAPRRPGRLRRTRPAPATQPPRAPHPPRAARPARGGGSG